MLLPTEGGDSFADRLIMTGAAFEGSAEIVEAGAMARDFFTTVQAVHGLPVPKRALGTVQVVVSELVTNARKLRARTVPAGGERGGAGG